MTTSLPVPDRAELVRDLAGSSITAVFCWRRAPGEWRVEKIAAVDDLPRDFGNAATEAAADLASRSLSPYNPEGNLLDNEFAILPNPRDLATATSRIGGNLFPALDDFGNAKVYKRRANGNAVPKMYVVIAQFADGSQAKFGRKIPNSNVLSSPRAIRTRFDGDTFSTVDGTIVAFDTDFDWVEWKDIIWILGADGFHALFRDMAEMRAAVAANVALIETKIKIVGTDDLIQRCRQSKNMMAKLQKVIDQRLFEKPIPMLQAYAAKYPGLHVVWSGSDLVFDKSMDRQWSILRLLDEAAFTGELSGESMLTKIKDPL